MMSPPTAPSKGDSTHHPSATFSAVSKPRTTARAATLDTLLGCVSLLVPAQRFPNTGVIVQATLLVFLPQAVVACHIKCSARPPCPRVTHVSSKLQLWAVLRRASEPVEY